MDESLGSKVARSAGTLILDGIVTRTYWTRFMSWDRYWLVRGIASLFPGVLDGETVAVNALA